MSTSSSRYWKLKPHAPLWALSLTIITGAAGWHLLRHRPLHQVRKTQTSPESIVAGDLTHRLPLSNRRDELDMLAAIVNAMLERIKKLMTEVKGSDSIAHDLRIPLTRLRGDKRPNEPYKGYFPVDLRVAGGRRRHVVGGGCASAVGTITPTSNPSSRIRRRRTMPSQACN